MNHYKFVIVVPCYQPDERFIKLLKDFVSVRTEEYIVIIDDGSESEYQDFFARAESIIGSFGCILKHDINRGKGAALKTGFTYLQNTPFLTNNVIGAITVDSDGQHSTEAIKSVEQSLVENPEHLILGARGFTGSDIPWKSKIGNELTKKVFRFVTGKSIQDTQTGLRGIPLGYVKKCTEISGDRFEYETNMLLDATRSLGIVEVPIRTIYDSVDNHSTHFNPLVDSIKIYSVLLRSFAKYIFSSLTSAMIDITLFLILCSLLRDVFQSYILVSSVAARTLSACFNYCVNHKYVFKSERHRLQTAKGYLILCLSQAFLSGILVTVFVSLFALSEALIKVMVDSVLFFASYYIQQNFIFKVHEEDGLKKQKWGGIKRDVIRLFTTYIGVVCIGILSLVLASMLRQDLIDEHILESVSVFEEEGQYPHIGDKEVTSALDNFTDALILEEATVMQFDNLQTIISNPMYFSTNPVEVFPTFASDRESLEETAKYVRYWQGFRVPIRILLTVANYAEIRLLLSWVIMILLVSCVLFISYHTDTRTAIAFAISIIFIKPQVICNSIQYSSCFILSMIFVLLVPTVIKRKIEIPFFFACGMLTMFFDFYTAPLVAMGYPLIFLIVLKTREKTLVGDAICLSLIWAVGYGVMWITKLLLATIFTDLNGFENGFRSFAMRTGINKRDDLLKYYDFPGMVKHFYNTVFNNSMIISISVFVLAVLVICLIITLIKDPDRKIYLLSYSALLVPIVIMLIWYAVATQPTRIHAYFQYRNISMAIWALIMYLSIPGIPIEPRDFSSK